MKKNIRSVNVSPSDDKVVPFRKPAAKSSKAPKTIPDIPVWQCSCGCQLFFLEPSGPVCKDCEAPAIGWIDWK